ncbi:hypothetical protein JTE90_023446 [Oedothorax gibbosus]|uniref:DDE Tnp4 domain-containing protein n=1 Tax=Oedothorax gibbosus TaxID=931172 RepID=A0AAV6U1J4_9ARAC|nr:hypothetical protein JTE90_023446 [Oedothorax gibbosus]
MALVDAELNLVFVDVGTNGRMSDGGVWAKCAPKAALEINDLHVPPATNLPGANVKFPYVIVADDAFPLSQNIMKPYPGKGVGDRQRIFNYPEPGGWGCFWGVGSKVSSLRETNFHFRFKCSTHRYGYLCVA